MMYFIGKRSIATENIFREDDDYICKWKNRNVQYLDL